MLTNKTNDNMTWTFCYVKYSVNGKELRGFGILGHDIRSSSVDYDVFLPLEYVFAIGVNDVEEYRDCFLHTENFVDGSRLTDEHPKNNIFYYNGGNDDNDAFRSFEKICKYIKSKCKRYYSDDNATILGISKETKSAGKKLLCNKNFSLVLYNACITHTVHGNGVIIEDHVPVVMLDNKPISIGYLYHKNVIGSKDLIRSFLGVSPLLSSYDFVEGSSSLSLSQMTEPVADMTISGDLSNVINTLVAESRKYLKRLLDGYNNAIYGSNDRKKYRYLLGKYLGKGTNSFLRKYLQYEIYTVNNGEISYEFIRIPGIDSYIQLSVCHYLFDPSCCTFATHSIRDVCDDIISGIDLNAIKEKYRPIPYIEMQKYGTVAGPLSCGKDSSKIAQGKKRTRKNKKN